MIGLTLLGVLFAFVAWRLARRRRDVVLAGRDSERPTYSVEPPTRRMGRPLKDALL